MRILQKGFNYSQDGKGNRLVYHLQGCNFRCKWCSNPESMPLKNPEAREYTVDEIVSEAVRSRMMFFDGGGVTFTGGECTLQFDELREALVRLKEQGIDTAIETNGSSPGLAELAPFIDGLIIDLKHFNSEEHLKWTGRGNAQVIKNLERLFASGKKILVRIPIIKGVNDNPDGFLNFLAGFDVSNAEFEFLPYHEFGKDKWTEKYEITDGFISKEKLAEFNKKFINSGYSVTVT